MHSADLQSLAERIHTGATASDSSRALIAFNLTDQSLTGVAAFHADMSWPVGMPLPPVIVQDSEGQAVASAVTKIQERPDRKGRSERKQLTFDLRFAVRDVPPHGWRTYVATYGSVPTPDTALPDDTPGLIVVETLRQTGDLPPVGSLPRDRYRRPPSPQ